MGILGKIYENVYGFLPSILQLELEEWRIAKGDKGRIKSVVESIGIIESRWPSNSLIDETDNPIFIFASGWRSGSTLLQRLIMSHDQTLIWGEPFNQFNIIQRQACALSAVCQAYPPENWTLNAQRLRHNSSEKLSKQFIPNLYPDFQFLRLAHQSFFLNLFKTPAVNHGYSRWGLKEVRLGIDTAVYLKWVFPNAKFLFLYRNPYEAYASLKPNLHLWSLYEVWPETPIRTPSSFGKFWRKLVTGYLESADELDGLVIKYEDLCSGKFSIDKLEEYLGLSISRRLLEHKVGSTKGKPSLTPMEVFLIRKSVNPLATRLGYS